jgi:hypothetical protein
MISVWVRGRASRVGIIVSLRMKEREIIGG